MTATVADAPVGILRRPYLLTTVGAWSIAFLVAFESLAVSTIMPVVTVDLDGRAFYALTFSAVLGAGVIGMVVCGSWADSRGPVAPLFTAIVLFGVGLVLAGTARSMPVFVAGRFLQGLGAAVNVALYVLIARIYPPSLHIKVFSAFASAWVLPSLVGPFLAGVVADVFGWHWVFLGVVLLVALAGGMMLPALRGLPPGGRGGPPFDRRRIGAAVVVALGVVALSYGGAVEQWLAWALAPVVVLVIVFAARGLLPPGTFRASPGLPSVVLLAGASGAVFYATDVYLPLLLHDRYGLPAWLSGITLTTGAVAWSIAATVQGRLGDRLAPMRAVRAGGILLAAGVGIVLGTAALGLHPVVAAFGWFVGGAGMGTLTPRISALTLAWSVPGEEGFNTAAKSIADWVGGSVALAVTGLIFAGLGADTTVRTPYAGVLLTTSLLALLVVVIAGRAAKR